ncbi:MAG TPA: ABC transporter substrate-binding protein [bacterium]|nr:ABC transporter substrate-binding protein [bacterium]
MDATRGPAIRGTTGRVGDPARLSRRGFLIGAATLAGTGAATGVSFDVVGGARAADAPKRGGKVTWGMTSDPVATIPFGAVNGSNFEITSLIYESLLGWDRQLNVKSALAESWEIPDDKTYIFRLRKGVKFHSGKELDAADVAYSLELQKTPPPPGITQSYYPKIATVEATDKYTVRVRMAQPDATMMGYLAWGRYSWIIPKGLYDKMDLRTHADGTGPFKLEEYIPNDHTRVSRFKDYWRPALPYLDEVTMKVLQDEQARVAALRSGAIDGASVTADSAATLRGDASLEILKGLTAVFREVEFTLKNDGKPWDNVKVRQAMNAAINRQEIIEKVYGGDAVYTSKIPQGYGPWPLSQDALKLKWERYDIPKARQLMAEAGYANGFSVTMQSIAHPIDYTQNAEVIKDQLKLINVNVTVQPLEIGTFARNNGRGEFEWQSTGRGMRGDPSGFLADFDPAGAVYKAWYQAGYNNKELTDLYFEGLRTTDRAKRLQIYRRLQEIVLTEWPALPLVNPMKYQVVRRRLHGYYVAYDDTERGLIGAWVE